MESRFQRADTISLHHILHNLLIVGVNSEKKQFIYNEIATHAIPILSKFDARCLSNPRFQDDVISVLSSIGLLPEEEELTSGYFLDALIEVNDIKVGIEVDGPSHFINRQRAVRFSNAYKRII